MMAKTSDFQGILSEIELFLNAGRYDDAKVLLNFVDHDAADRTTRLHLLLINATIDGPARYKDEIDSLTNLSDANAIEKEITRQILLLASNGSKKDDLNDRPHSHPPNQSFHDTASRVSPANPVEENTEHPRNYETELAALKEQLAELAASKDHALVALQATVNQQAELLQAKEADLDALETHYSGIIGMLENQLHDKEDLRTAHEAELQAARAEVGRLTAEFAEFADAKDLQINALCEELTHQTDLLQFKDSAIKQLEEQYAEQLHALENQLGEQQNLLNSRNAELDSCSIQLRELTREHAELKSARETSENLAREELREKADQLQTMATAIDELEAQSSAAIASLQWQLTEKQTIVERREVELAELHGQLLVFTERLADADVAHRSIHPLVQDEFHRAGEAIPATYPGSDNAILTRLPIGTSIDIASAVFQDTISDWLSGLRHAWQRTRKPQIFSPTALPVAASVLLILPIAYLLAVQDRTTTIPNPNVGLKPTRESVASENPALPLKELKPPPTADTGSRKIVKRDTAPAPAATYVTRRPTTLRESPRYAAPAKSQIVSGTQVSVIGSQGDWFKVKTESTGTVGYVRKEYLQPHKSAQY